MLQFSVGAGLSLALGTEQKLDLQIVVNFMANPGSYLADFLGSPCSQQKHVLCFCTVFC